MRLGDQVIGMISAQTYQTYDYTPEDQQILEMLAAYSAIAINNARLFAEVRRLAITDSLTGVFNRRYFFTSIQNEFRRSERYGHPLSMMMLDLDHFKAINDTYGHDIGDEIIKEVSQFCQDNIRKLDILARYGGDEFVILLPETNLNHATELAERLRGMIESQSIQIGEMLFQMTISIGVTGIRDESVKMEDFLKNVDQALYAAKEAGRNTVRSHRPSQEKHP
jgi:diguanylate cyclase (GGDEF)-like protein